jgi:hypothetical protein
LNPLLLSLSVQRYTAARVDAKLGNTGWSRHFINPLAGTAAQRLFLVINMTLNVTSGGNVAWAERKAEVC